MNLAKKLLMTTGTSSGTVPAPSGGYVDDVFSTYLYTGNGSTQTINNGIDLAGEGGLVWIKGRSGATDHALYDTARGATLDLVSNSTAGQITQSTGLTTFGNSGFSVGSLAKLNTNSSTYTSWTFRKAPKFFDIVTYTGDGTSNRQIPHSLGVAPGMIVVKRTGSTGTWAVYHKSIGSTKLMSLEGAAAAAESTVYWNNTEPTASNFSVGIGSAVNASGAQYVAYLFAHDPSAEGIIQCGSFTTDASGNFAPVNLGWEPQYVMYKASSVSGSWLLMDSMRGMPVGGNDAYLSANTVNQEFVDANKIDPNATGFSVTGASTSTTYIYMTIRRPNKPPTSGTQVYNGVLVNSSVSAQTVDATFASDLVVKDYRNLINGAMWFDRLRGYRESFSPRLLSSSEAEGMTSDVYTGSQTTITEVGIGVGYMSVDWFFRRAPTFFDIVCHRGTGIPKTEKHSLAAIPEMLWVKRRDATGDWRVYHKDIGNDRYLVLNSNGQKSPSITTWNTTSPSSSVFSLGADAEVNALNGQYVSYLFSTCPGISKVGSYNGNGGSQTIPCGFTTGSRFVLIKRIDNTGDWFVWDTARGITPTTDPHLSLNTAAAEVTTDDSIDQDVSGFIVNQNAATNINALGGNYLFLAIA